MTAIGGEPSAIALLDGERFWLQAQKTRHPANLVPWAVSPKRTREEARRLACCGPGYPVF
jgi:hypothetical protein